MLANRFITPDGVRVCQGKRNVIQSFHQTAFAKIVDHKEDRGSIGRRYCLSRKIHGQTLAGQRFDRLEHSIDYVVRQDYWEHRVFEAIPMENIGVTRRDQSANAEIVKRPSRMFAAGAACSRLEPHPKFSRVNRIEAPW